MLACRTPSFSLTATRSMPIHLHLVASNLAYDRLFQQTLFTKLSQLPSHLKNEVSDFIEFLNHKSKRQNKEKVKRIPGKAKGMIRMKDNFDEPIEGFN